MKYQQKLVSWLNLRRWFKPTPDERLNRAIFKIKTKEAQRLQACFYELQFHVHDGFRGSLHSVPTFDGLCKQIDDLSRAYAHLKLREKKLVKLLNVADESKIIGEVQRLVDVDFERDREKEQVRNAFKLVKIGRDAQAEGLAVLYGLKAKMDQEDRNYWPKNRI